MTENAERVKQEVLQLPEADRAELVRFLIESLDDSEDPDVDAAWTRNYGEESSESNRGTRVCVPRIKLAEIRDNTRA